MLRTHGPATNSRPTWPPEAGRAVEWVDYWGANVVQSMQSRLVAYPRGMRNTSIVGGRTRDVSIQMPAQEKPHPFMHQAYAGFMELRIPTTLPSRSKERVARLLVAEGTELRSHVNGMRTADPTTRKPYPPPRPVSVWLLMHRRSADGGAGNEQTGLCPNELDYLDGFTHLFASHEPGGDSLQRHVRGAVACGDDALDVIREHKAGGFEGAALLIVTHAHETGVGSDPICMLYQLNANRVTLSSVVTRGDPPSVVWKDVDDRPPRRLENVAELFRTVLTDAAKFKGVHIPTQIFNPLAPMPPDAFRRHVAEASHEFSSLLEAEPVVRRAPYMPEETALCVTGVMMRITPWLSLHNATERQFAATAHNAHLSDHERRHITSMSRFERDAFPAMLLCAKGHEEVARSYASEFWSLRPIRGTGEEAAWMHVAQLCVRPLAIHNDISAYGMCGVAGEPVGEGVLGQRQLTMTPMGEVDIAKHLCVQPCSLLTLTPKVEDRDVLRAYHVAIKALASFVDCECVASYPNLLDGCQEASDFAIDQHGTQHLHVASSGSPSGSVPLRGGGRAQYKRPHVDIYGATTGRMLLPFDLLSTRTTVGEACAFVGVTGDHVAEGVRALVFAMLAHCGASKSLGEALVAHARLSEAYMESGADAEEIARLRRVDVASQRMRRLEGSRS